MQVWTAKIGGKPTKGDTVFLHWCGHKGGRTSAGHIVKNGDNTVQIRDGIIESARNYMLGGEQEIKARGDDSLVIMTSREDGEFITEVTGEKTEVFTIEKF